jgi:CRP-like cAMP-binding protein
MDSGELRGLLDTLDFTSSLPTTALDEWARIARVKTFPAGAVLFREGARNPDVFLIVRGHVALEMCVPGRGCMQILSLGPGDILAWSALEGAGHMTATALAQEETEVIVAPGDALLGLCERNHEIGYAVMKRLATAISQRLVATRLQMLDLFGAEPLSWSKSSQGAVK